MGVDRTFGLSVLLVTITVFHQLNLQTTVRNAHPVVLGPVLITTDATQQTYEFFFESIRAKLNEPLTGIALNENLLIFGLDQKQAIVTALKRKW